MAMVCLCHGVSERKVAKAIARGADDLAAVGAACGAGTCCGGCHDTILGLLAEHAPAPTAAPVAVRPALA